jgi:hypothetical protein
MAAGPFIIKERACQGLKNLKFKEWYIMYKLKGGTNAACWNERSVSSHQYLSALSIRSSCE